ncbi:putative thioesterase superfamily protein [Diaporthe ampelina]|uniref:Putative thioesterase superfamily protein n=1 Tax=Diaporthe ampelina TaxID=1214573 RepID=A0A0G2I421_9PEZI|nr:putative thioesterase superfamily protein [Diaporthe ampelina]
MASTSRQQPPPPEDDIKHFKSIPWCLRHLQPPDTELIITSAYSRSRKPSSEDALFSETINSPSTLSHFILFYPRPPDPQAVLPEIRGLITLGSSLDGHPGICHGGIVATVFDEVLGYAAPAGRLTGEGQGAGRAVPSYVTAYLNTTYLRPVRTPGTVMVVARTTKVEGRKIWVEASMEDGRGEKLARAEALFVEVRLKL